jgi:hypothetical protein
VFEKLRADWRRGRALKVIQFGEDSIFEIKTPVGPVMLVGRFAADGKTLVLTVREIYAKDVTGPKGQYRAEPGLGAVRNFMEWIAGMASDLGYTRMRVRGHRTRSRRKEEQNFEFPLDRYLRGQRPRR